MGKGPKHSMERLEKPAKAPERERGAARAHVLTSGRLNRHRLRIEIKNKPPAITYREGEVRFAKKKSELGRLQRALRFKNITDAVEKRYGIPEGLLLGMMMHESYADPFQPNESGDGGLGLIHMQPLKGAEYGLKILNGSRALRDFSLGRKLRLLIKDHYGDLQKLKTFDDRFDLLKNIDAAGRMMRDHFQQTKDWDTALRYYSGRPYKEYGRFVRRFQQTVRHNHRKAVQDFETRNSGKKFQKYIDRCYEQNELFGLKAYIKETSARRSRKKTALARQP